ncbi:T9SS type A sorting domain-containing protein [Winogradskyella sp.]|uniref:T9SS type A sorting domain-containing protein n=1 Tax=Winogradskyella sp. TaxID=1883156 RepID=UPI0025F54EFC|nr:T9SS type A sorting domain-containing protein [Winogradskyella sp.]
MKIKFTLYIMSCIGAFALNAQNNTLSTGGNATGSNGSISYSVGQVSYIEISGSGTINEGLQQPFELITLSSGSPNAIILKANIFPNPTSNFIQLELKNHNAEGLLYRLIDQNGRVLLSNDITTTMTTINLDSYIAATYYVSVMQGSRLLKTFKVIKH